MINMFAMARNKMNIQYVSEKGSLYVETIIKPFLTKNILKNKFYYIITLLVQSRALKVVFLFCSKVNFTISKTRENHENKDENYIRL